MDADTARIERRFNGPPNSGNGGYACGLLGALIGDSAEVTLRKPPPLETEMEITHEDGEWTLSDGEMVIATGHATELNLDVPAPPSFDDATAAESNYIDRELHIFPTCFVCGPDRHHGLNAVRLMRAQKAADFSYIQVAPYQVFKPLF